MSDYQQALPAHVKWLLDHQASGLMSCLGHQGCRLEAVQVLRVLMAADPSPGHHGVDWLARCLIAGGLRWEDVASGAHSRAATALAAFAQHRASLPLGGRNLVGYTSLGALNHALHAVLEVAPVEGSRSIRRQDRAEARAQSIMLCDTPELIVAVPTTRWAACWWGRGTQWCTAADKDNAFDHYNRTAPLIVVVLPGVESGKLQLHMDNTEYDYLSYDTLQFMDVHDREVSLKYIELHWNRLGPLVEWMAVNHADGLNFVPQSRSTPQLRLAAVQASPWALHSVPMDQRTDILCQTALLASTGVMQLLPDHFRTSDFYMGMVSTHRDILRMIPSEHISADICRAAVAVDGISLRNVPDQYRDADMAWSAVAENAHALAHVPQHLRTAELCAMAMRGAHATLSDVPEQYRSPRLCLNAVQNSGLNLASVPNKLRTHIMCSIAVRKHGQALLHVPKKWITLELVRTAVRTHGCAIECAPRELLDAELCARAVEQDGMAIEHVPQELRTPELIKSAIRTYPDLVKRLPAEIATNELWGLAMMYKPLLSGYPREGFDDGVYYPMLARSGMNLGYVPGEHKTAAVCIKALENTRDAWIFVPDELYSEVRAATGLQSVNVARWRAETALAGLAECLGRPANFQCVQDGSICIEHTEHTGLQAGN